MIGRDLLRKLTPNSILNWNRKRKKKKINAKLTQQKKSGAIYTKQQIKNDLLSIGLKNGDCILVHSALSKIGYLEEGPKTLVDALIEVVGEEGHILMPTSPNHVYQLNYIRNTPLFDVLNSPSKTGAITEYFRTLTNVKRSLHPTEPVSVLSQKADQFIEGHFKAITPYTSSSPFAKVAEFNGKILYIGVTLDNAGTSLHTLEDAIEDFKYPIYYPEIFSIKVIDSKGESHTVKTKVHDPKYSKLRQCDKLIPHFENAGALKPVKIGLADTLCVDAKLFFNTMVSLYNEKGITMYTPNGGEI
ncbi:MAG: AAC(3) family N-acetyltransferase [Crocinitomicaceae bacterium]